MIDETVNNWYQLPAPDAFNQMSVDPEQGLTIAEVDRLQHEYGPNAPTLGERKGSLKRKSFPVHSQAGF